MFSDDVKDYSNDGNNKVVEPVYSTLGVGTTRSSNPDVIEITDYVKFEDVINRMQNSLNTLHDVFENERNNDNTLTDGSTWEGKASEQMYAKVKELEENYEPIEYSLDLYISFLRKTLEDYKLMDDEINKNAVEFAHALDVNK